MHKVLSFTFIIGARLHSVFFFFIFPLNFIAFAYFKWNIKLYVGNFSRFNGIGEHKQTTMTSITTTVWTHPSNTHSNSINKIIFAALIFASSVSRTVFGTRELLTVYCVLCTHHWSGNFVKIIRSMWTKHEMIEPRVVCDALLLFVWCFHMCCR